MNPNSDPVPPLVVERVLNAPVSTVWQALTTSDAMKRWYFEMDGFRPEVGCEFSFVVEHHGNRFDHRCRVTAVVPQQRISYTWRYHGHEGESHVVFELFPEGKGTRLKLTHTGLETFPKVPAFDPQNFTRGWNSLLGQELPDYVENLDRELFQSRDFTAPRELVWNAMTQAEHVVHWWGPRGFTSTVESLDFRVGGVWKIVMHGPDGTDYPNEHHFQEIVPFEKIVMSHQGRCEGRPQVLSVATWTFESLPSGRTRVNLRMVFPSAEHRDTVVREYGAIEGAKETLMRLGERIAGQRCEPFVLERDFAAPLERVWKAWTEIDHLARWFGPKGFTNGRATLDLRPGGSFHYSQIAPDGRELWGKFDYLEVVPLRKLVWVNYFSDANGGVTRHPFTQLEWPLRMFSEATFAEHQGGTRVTLRWVPLDATDAEIAAFNSMRSSMSQGWSGTFERLIAHLAEV